MMISGDLASKMGIKPGYYVSLNFRAEKIVNMNSNGLLFAEFVSRSSPNTGFVSPSINNMIASSTGARGYSADTRYENRKPKTYVMTSHFLYVYATNGGAKIQKWYPFDPANAEWNFGAVVMM